MRYLITLAFTALFAISAPAFGAGSGGTSDDSPAKKCQKGEVLKEVVENGTKKTICVKADAGVLPDEELYQQGAALAKEGQYDWALEVLALVQNQNDPRVLNYVGYSHRKAGRLDTGIEYYRKALAINPDFVLAREYLGEGYVASGRVDLAKAELAEIEKRCGTACEEYQDLSEAIAAAN